MQSFGFDMSRNNGKKIILTIRELSSNLHDKLSSSVGGMYVIRSPVTLRDEDFSNVEILLLDTVLQNDLEWLSPSSLMRFPNLKLIQSTRAGVDVIKFEEIPSGVLVCGNVGAYGEQIAEHVFGMILYFARNIGWSNQLLARGVWQVPESIFLKGKTILVLGAGGIGEPVAKLATSFGMKTLGVNTSGKSVPDFDQVVSLDKFEDLVTEADVIVVALPLTVGTFHLIGAKVLSKMKSECILVNIARGYIIDEAALYTHLKRNPAFKCALDVWWHYPKKGEKFAQLFPFFDLPNFLGTPHDSGVVPETQELALLSSFENIARYAKNEPLRGLMDRKDYQGLKELIDKVN
jgi:phosphoglycerate dehydrogenase-like enzyme